MFLYYTSIIVLSLCLLLSMVSLYKFVKNDYNDNLLFFLLNGHIIEFFKSNPADIKKKNIVIPFLLIELAIYFILCTTFMINYENIDIKYICVILIWAFKYSINYIIERLCVPLK